jgi:nicotinamide riboside kinase
MCKICDDQVDADGEVQLLKVGFLGAGGTGKTTVAKLLEANSSIPEKFHGSVSRPTFEKFGIRTEADQMNMTPAQRWELQKAISFAKMNQDLETRHGIFDRTPVDQMAYSLYRCADIMGEEEFNFMHKYVERFTSQYDLLFFFPIYFWGDTVADGMRQTNYAYRRTYEIILQGLLDEMRLQYIMLPDADPESRAEYITAEMETARNDSYRARIADPIDEYEFRRQLQQQQWQQS